MDDACGPSKQMELLLKKVDFEFDLHRLESEPRLARDYGIKAVPTTIIVDQQNKPIKTFVGYSKQLPEMIKGYLD